MTIELAPEVVERLTGDPVVAHLATSVDDRPHVAQVWYVYADGVVELTTTGRKLANLRRNPRVALSFGEEVAGVPEWTVTLLGTATVVEDDDAFEAANRRINAKYGARPDAHAENTLVRIEPASATSREY
ncbi:MAG: pyridoxamine 5'-phosphate oxidase family protein [Haloferacaceae archaeon]